MVDAVSKLEKLVLHQALHGYSNGHRVLSCSKKLENRDAKTLLIMSDISGPGTQLPEEGYLTGYPLLECGYFAFSRTWPAPEMPRPGCVWTHTLLVEFSDLALITDLRKLNDFFRRPNQDEYTGYSQPVYFIANERPGPASLNNLWASSLIGGLYGLPGKKILVQPPTSGSLDELVLSIWSQQWPKLRRSFRFCTFAVSDRIVDGVQFDLQLLPPESRNLQSRFAGGAFVPLEQPQLSHEWIRFAVEDLDCKLELDFRKYLRQTGGDYDNGRSAFAPLCDLYSGLQRNDLAKVKALLLGPLAGARSTLTYSISRMTDHLHDIDGELIEFILSNLNTLSKGNTEEIAPHLGSWLWTYRLQSIATFLSSPDTVEGRAVKSSLLDSELNQVLDWVRLAPSNLGSILPLRPDLLSKSGIWEMSKDACEIAMVYVSANPDLELEAISSAIAANREFLPSLAFRHVGSRRMLSTMLYLAEKNDHRVDELAVWFRASASAATIGVVLGSGTSWSTKALSILARNLNPRDVPNEQGRDPWLIALRNTHDMEVNHDYLDAFLLARALQYRSANSEDLVVICFERVAVRAYAGELTSECWSLLKDSADRPWYVTTKLGSGDLIALAVVNLFVDREFSPQAFNALTSNDALFNHLLNLASLRYRSRSFLVELEKWLSIQRMINVSARLERLRVVLKKL